MRSLLLLSLVAAAATASPAQSPAPTAADSARADLPLIRRADAARTRGAGPGGAIDTLRPTIHEFVDHACPSCRAFSIARGDSVTRLARDQRANLVLRVSPIPGLLRGMHAAEAAFCAGAVGGPAAFEEVHAQLLEQQDAWRHRKDPMPVFQRLAQRAGIDTTRFIACVSTGATRPLVHGDARLAGQLAVDGTPTLLVTRASGLGPAIRVVGEASMPRIERALRAADSEGTDLPTAYAVVGRWQLDSIDIYRWAPASSADARLALGQAQQTAARTVSEIKAGALVIETVFQPTLRYTHTLRRGDRLVYSETGAWAVPGMTGRLHVTTDAGDDGTNHLARLVARDGRTLVLERHFTTGPARGTAERLFLTQQPTATTMPDTARPRD